MEIMLIQVGIAALMIIATTGIHAGMMILALRESKHEHMNSRLRLTRGLRISGIVLIMFFASIAEALLWAAAYLIIGAVEGFEQAFYFSMVTFATLGYGDVVLVQQWRLLGSFEAANGVILFGWTTAIVVAAVQRIYLKQEHA